MAASRTGASLIAIGFFILLIAGLKSLRSTVPSAAPHSLAQGTAQSASGLSAPRTSNVHGGPRHSPVVKVRGRDCVGSPWSSEAGGRFKCAVKSARAEPAPQRN